MDLEASMAEVGANQRHANHGIYVLCKAVRWADTLAECCLVAVWLDGWLRAAGCERPAAPRLATTLLCSPLPLSADCSHIPSRHPTACDGDALIPRPPTYPPTHPLLPLLPLPVQ
jgi:hypothetical protein